MLRRCKTAKTVQTLVRLLQFPSQPRVNELDRNKGVANLTYVRSARVGSLHKQVVVLLRASGGHLLFIKILNKHCGRGTVRFERRFLNVAKSSCIQPAWAEHCRKTE